MNYQDCLIVKLTFKFNYIQGKKVRDSKSFDFRDFRLGDTDEILEEIKKFLYYNFDEIKHIVLHYRTRNSLKRNVSLFNINPCPINITKTFLKVVLEDTYEPFIVSKRIKHRMHFPWW